MVSQWIPNNDHDILWPRYASKNNQTNKRRDEHTLATSKVIIEKKLSVIKTSIKQLIYVIKQGSVKQY